MYYRLHEQRVSENEFITAARTWVWDFDDDGNLYEREVPGVYSATKNPQDLLNYLGGHAGDDESVAVFEGEVIAIPETDCPGEVWVRPTRLVKWITVADLKKMAQA